MKQFPAISRTPCHCERVARTLTAGSEIIPALHGGLVRKFWIAPWVALFLGLLQVTGHAITVQNANDSGSGSLREAIQTGGTIDFAPSLSGQTITLASELVLGTSMTIDASSLTGVLTISGGGTNRLIRVNAGQNVTLRALTLIGGNGTGAADSAYGGALYTAGTTLVESCTFMGNSVTFYGGAISNSGILTVTRSTFSGNTADFEGGGIYSDFSSTLTVTNSTFTGNSAAFYGGAIFNGSPRMSLGSSTLVGNHADRIGGGIYNDFFGTPSSSIQNSIVTQNTAPEGANIFGPSTGTNNLIDVDPKLSPLGEFGGFTKTMPPLPDSPALNGGGPTTLLTDQRGQPRILHTALDIGACEVPYSDYNPTGVTIYSRVTPLDQSGVFQISTDPDFLPTVSTFAGTGVAGFVEDQRLSAKLGYPFGVAQDSAGNIFFVDTGNQRIRMIGPDGIVSTIAGSGAYGLANGPGSVAAFAFPSALAVGPDGNLYVADTYNHRICKLTRPADPAGEWTVTSLAGTGIAGFVEGAGAVARFNFPYGLTLDSSGNVFVADSLNHRIRKVTPTGSVSTFAGSGTAGFQNSPTASLAKFDTPQGVVIAAGNLFVADTFNDRIRKVAVVNGSAGEVSTFAGAAAGFANGTGTAAQFNTPSGIATDGAGSLYIADEQNQRIRQIDSLGAVTTVAGSGTQGLVNGKSNVAQFNAPTGVFVALDGNLVVADSQNHVLRRITIKPLEVPSTAFTDAYGVQVKTILDVVALGLDPSVTYYFRWKSASTGVTQPLGQSFYLYDFPRVVTQAASNLTPSSAVLNGDVDPKSGKTVVTFEYSTDPGLLKPYQVRTAAGSGVAGFANDTGAAAQFSNPAGVVANAGGDVFVADRLNHRIRKITAAGVVTTFVGSGVAGFADGAGASAKFEKPTGLAIDGSGNLYVGDESNHRIRMITPAGVVSTIAGSGVAGFAEGAAAFAKFLYPSGVAVDADGNVFVADSGNQRIRKITVATGTVSTLAGTGVDGFADGAIDLAQFSSPQALAVDALGSVWVADTGNHSIRVIAAGSVTTLAGSGVAGFLDDSGTTARFSSPQGIVLDGTGTAYIADGGNHRIRQIDPGGQVSTFAGSGTPGQVDSPLLGLYPVTACQFNLPLGIALDAAGTLFITQEGMLRKISRSATLPTVTVTPDATGTGERALMAAVDQPLLFGATYYFQARGTGYRDSVTGGIMSFVTPRAEISLFAGTSASAPPLTHQQATPVDFGSTPNGQPVTRSFTISNPGNWPLAVSAVDLPSGYQLTGGVGIVSSLGSLTFQVILPATSAGTFGGGIAIHSDAHGQVVFTFPITGVVLDPPELVTLAASAVGTNTATLNATVNPKDSSTTVWFEWSLDSEFDGVRVTTVVSPQAGSASGVVTDAVGNTYVADTANHRIRKIAPDGTASTFAGSGVAGFADGSAATAQFDQPIGLALSTTGILFVADSNNHRIRAINSAGDVTTYSGLGTSGFTDGIPTAARFHTPGGLAIDGNGTLFVADSGNHRIRKVAPDGSVSTLAGTGAVGSGNGSGTAAEFATPLAIAMDSAGFAYVTEAASHAIRRIAADGFTSVFAGSAATAGMVNGASASARFSNPVGLAVGINGVLYVADKGNHRIRTISTGGIVRTIAGSGIAGTLDGVGEAAQFQSPISLATTATGGVTVGESASTSLRNITSLQVLLQAAAGLTGTAQIAVVLPVIDLPASGPYYFRSIATNGGGTTIGATLGNATYQAWAISKFGADATNPLIGRPSASPSGDGISNLLKYAFGLDPYMSAAGSVPVVGLAGGLLTLTYNKVLVANDLLYAAEWSTDLENWSSVGITEQPVGEVAAIQQILATTPAAPGGSKFLRVRITLK